MLHNKKYQEIKKELLRKNGAICWYCGYDLTTNEIHIDHIHPRSEGGSDDIDNLALSCEFCNRAKFNRDVTVFLRWLGRIRTGNFECFILRRIKHDLSDNEEDRLNKEF